MTRESAGPEAEAAHVGADPGGPEARVGAGADAPEALGADPDAPAARLRADPDAPEARLRADRGGPGACARPDPSPAAARIGADRGAPPAPLRADPDRPTPSAPADRHAPRPTPDPDPDLTEDALLDGRVRLRQPARGYRAATDPVLLAAAVAAAQGARVLDLGCGVGAAALCLAARTPGLTLHGLERDGAAAALARGNAAANGVALTVWDGDVARPPAGLRQIDFDAVMMNPPYFDAAAAASPTPPRDAARREAPLGLETWIDQALRRLRQGGRLTLIHRAEATPRILAALGARAGEITLLPLVARAGRPAGRVIVAARKDSRAPFRLLAPLVLHAGPAHPGDRDHFTPQAAAILRDGAPLALRAP